MILELLNLGHPTTVFCRMSVRRIRGLPRIFRYLRTAKNFQMIMTVPFMYNFQFEA